jgi:pimeloyl-ACP methyl ester carboxylesterase
VVVALHGLRGRSDWACHVGRELFEESAFVLCPAGTPLPAKTAADRARPRYTFPSLGKTAQEIAAGLGALATEYGASVDTTKPVLYGHSLGAIFGAELAVRGSAWSRVLLSEGGYSTMMGPGGSGFAH